MCVCVFQEVCYQYWPTSGSECFGEYKVELLGEEMMDGSVLKTFSVTHSEVCGPCHSAVCVCTHTYCRVARPTR